jgi:DNA-directed RNA polymerase specialized sigma24 family protein
MTATVPGSPIKSDAIAVREDDVDISAEAHTQSLEAKGWREPVVKSERTAEPFKKLDAASTIAETLDLSMAARVRLLEAEGRSVPEIAALMNLSSEAVKDFVAHGKK